MEEFPKNPIEKNSDEERRKQILAEIKGLYGNHLVELAKNTHIMAHDEFLYADNVDDVNKLLERFEKEVASSNHSQLGFIETQLRLVNMQIQKEKEGKKSSFNKLFKK